MVTKQLPNRIVLLKNYIDEFGDPDTNGHGHERCMKNGQVCIRIPGKMEWLEESRETMGVSRKQTHVTSGTEAFRGQTSTMFEDLSTNLADIFARPRGTVMLAPNIENPLCCHGVMCLGGGCVSGLRRGASAGDWVAIHRR